MRLELLLLAVALVMTGHAVPTPMLTAIVILSHHGVTGPMR
jgi:hypothetical protein